MVGLLSAEDISTNPLGLHRVLGGSGCNQVLRIVYRKFPLSELLELLASNPQSVQLWQRSAKPLSVARLGSETNGIPPNMFTKQAP